MKLLLIRHGIRGVPVTDMRADLPVIAFKKDLSPLGNCFIRELIYFIGSSPEFILTDTSKNRTFQTALVLAKTSGLKYIYGSKLWRNYKIIKPEIKEIPQDLLKLKQMVEDLVPEVTFSGPELLEQLYRLSELTVFTKTLKINNPLNPIFRELLEAYTISQRHTQSAPVSDLLSMISGILKVYKLSIIVCHEHIINSIANSLNKPYHVPEYSCYFVPACSGFIFNLDIDRIAIQYLWLTLDGKFKIESYLNIDIPKGNFPTDLERSNI